MTFRDGARDTAAATLIGVWFWTVTAVLLAATALFFLWLKPTFLDREREAVEHSRQYITTVVNELLNDVQDVRDLEADIASYGEDGQYAQVVAAKRAQIKATLDRIERRMTNIPRSEVPQEVIDLLREYDRI